MGGSQGRRKGGVLVHCYAGQSRSVALILAYLVACARPSLSLNTSSWSDAVVKQC